MVNYIFYFLIIGEICQIVMFFVFFNYILFIETKKIIKFPNELASQTRVGTEARPLHERP